MTSYRTKVFGNPTPFWKYITKTACLDSMQSDIALDLSTDEHAKACETLDDLQRYAWDAMGVDAYNAFMFLWWSYCGDPLPYQLPEKMTCYGCSEAFTRKDARNNILVHSLLPGWWHALEDTSLMDGYAQEMMNPDGDRYLMAFAFLCEWHMTHVGCKDDGIIYRNMNICSEYALLADVLQAPQQWADRLPLGVTTYLEAFFTPLHMRPPLSPSLRYAILACDHFRCQLCGAAATDGAQLEVDHRQSRYHGGNNHEANLHTLCWACNRGKGRNSLA